MSDDNGKRYVFYTYNDSDDDPRFSFWMLMGGHGMSLYERPPDGQGMWLKPNIDSDYDPTEPTDALGDIAADLVGQREVSLERVEELPTHERHFVKVIHGTIDKNPDAVPGPVWAWMWREHDKRE